MLTIGWVAFAGAALLHCVSTADQTIGILPARCLRRRLTSRPQLRLRWTQVPSLRDATRWPHPRRDGKFDKQSSWERLTVENRRDMPKPVLEPRMCDELDTLYFERCNLRRGVDIFFAFLLYGRRGAFHAGRGERRASFFEFEWACGQGTCKGGRNGSDGWKGEPKGWMRKYPHGIRLRRPTPIKDVEASVVISQCIALCRPTRTHHPSCNPAFYYPRGPIFPCYHPSSFVSAIWPSSKGACSPRRQKQWGTAVTDSKGAERAREQLVTGVAEVVLRFASERG